MTKPRLSGQERRQQIIEKAAEVFAVRGAQGTRTRDIAVAANINEALIYRHFASKEELYREAMVHAYSEATKYWISEAIQQNTGYNQILCLLKAQLKTMEDNPLLCANMWHGISATTHDYVMKEYARRSFATFQDLVKNLIIAGQKDGSIRKDLDPDTGAWIIRGVSWTYMLRSIIGIEASDDAKDPESYCKIIASSGPDQDVK